MLCILFSLKQFKRYDFFNIWNLFISQSINRFELKKSASNFHEFPILTFQGNLRIKLYQPLSAIHSLPEKFILSLKAYIVFYILTSIYVPFYKLLPSETFLLIFDLKAHAQLFLFCVSCMKSKLLLFINAQKMCSTSFANFSIYHAKN